MTILLKYDSITLESLFADDKVANRMSTSADGETGRHTPFQKCTEPVGTMIRGML